jgi:AraC family transcriptional regulator, regulatory protein of adaptative response / DNA-3-methyladenine glycosylase II
MDMPPHEVCYRALASRDARFDGRLFVGVSSTGIYCRPICPAKTPKAENCRFFPSAAAAQSAGFRPCLRCRPEISPDAAAWRGTSNTVSRALALIAEGGLDSEAGVGALAEKLGVGERQLRRLFEKHLGAPPIAVAQTRRILFAKQLIQDSDLAMSAAAEASGFRSLRRFNDAFRKLYGKTPRELRRARSGTRPQAVRVRLGYRPPYDWDALLEFLAGRAVEGVEIAERDRYSRTIEMGGRFGSVSIVPARAWLEASIRFPDTGALLAIVARLRRLFDLDADVQTIGRHLSADAALAPLIAKRPGLRAPGGWDGFELAMRAILGQQVSVAAARKLAVRLVARTSPQLAPDATGDDALHAVFPTPARVAAADLENFGMPKTRIASLQALASAALADPSLLALSGRTEDAMERLLALPGFGPWTAQYWALRALRDGDAFPAADAALLRSPLMAENGKRPVPKSLIARAEAWRPWRAYAAQHLWAADNG